MGYHRSISRGRFQAVWILEFGCLNVCMLVKSAISPEFDSWFKLNLRGKFKELTKIGNIFKQVFNSQWRFHLPLHPSRIPCGHHRCKTSTSNSSKYNILPRQTYKIAQTSKTKAQIILQNEHN